MVGGQLRVKNTMMTLVRKVSRVILQQAMLSFMRNGIWMWIGQSYPTVLSGFEIMPKQDGLLIQGLAVM